MARVLVADDEPEIVEVVSAMLEAEGHDVVTASDGAEAVRQAVQVQPDLVILDIMMPRVDGLTALGQLRDGPLTKDIPVLLLSAKKGALDVEVGLKAGASAYLTKPFQRRELSVEVKRLTAGGRPG